MTEKKPWPRTMESLNRDHGRTGAGGWLSLLLRKGSRKKRKTDGLGKGEWKRQREDTLSTSHPGPTTLKETGKIQTTFSKKVPVITPRW